jgi:hypothetical protein
VSASPTAQSPNDKTEAASNIAALVVGVGGIFVIIAVMLMAGAWLYQQRKLHGAPSKSPTSIGNPDAPEWSVSIDPDHPEHHSSDLISHPAHEVELSQPALLERSISVR